mgnify:CR=1 FL=1
MNLSALTKTTNPMQTLTIPTPGDLHIRQRHWLNRKAE